MKRINDIFYSLQGEGHHTGRAAVFIRFAGCNLRCAFCDTDFDNYCEMSDEEIVDAIADYPSRFVVLTGGEPSLQVDEAFIDLLHRHGYEVAMETNGTHPLPPNLDWSTVSPKQSPQLPYNPYLVHRCNELKLVFTHPDEVDDRGIAADYYYLQPCDTGQPARNAEILQACVAYVQQHPRWRLSLQTHKLIGIK